jgi:large subunit ribosomal protein L21
LIRCLSEKMWQTSSVTAKMHLTAGRDSDVISPFRLEIMYAVLETGSKQYRVEAGDTLDVERLETEAGQSFTFERVLLVSTDGQTRIGAPTVANATIVVDVVEHLRGPKKVAFKMKRRKGYHRTVGHRQELTKIRIKEINV